MKLSRIPLTLAILSTELAHGPVVLVMLRGWPGYQCPFCTRQFGDDISACTGSSGDSADRCGNGAGKV
jgi:hypothetical protein